RRGASSIFVDLPAALRPRVRGDFVDPALPPAQGAGEHLAAGKQHRRHIAVEARVGARSASRYWRPDRSTSLITTKNPSHSSGPRAEDVACPGGYAPAGAGAGARVFG